MSITIAFRPLGAPPLSVVVENDVRFVSLGDQCPDFFIRPRTNGLTVIASNGRFDAPGKPANGARAVQGTLQIEVAGVPLVKKTTIDLRFGGAIPYRGGQAAKPFYQAFDAWDEHWLRHWPKDPAVSAGLRQRYQDAPYDFDDAPFFNGDQSGSERCTQVSWIGTMVAALRLGEDAEVWEAARIFLDHQMKWRHSIFYDTMGQLLRADEQPWWRVGRYGLDGTYKLDLVGEEDGQSPYERVTEQHIADDRCLLAAVGFGDEAAKLYCEADMECWLTRPEFRDAQTADDQRSHGYLVRRIFLQMLARNDQVERLGPWLARVVDGLRRAYGEWGDPTRPSPSRAPAKTGKWSHGYPTRVDWLAYAGEMSLVLPPELAAPEIGGTCDHLRPWLKATALERKLAGDYYTDGDDGLWGRHRAVVVWQCSVILHALCAVRDFHITQAFVPDVDQLIKQVVWCVVGPGSGNGMDEAGKLITTPSCWDAYASASRYLRVVRAESEKNGTITWMPDALLESEPSLGPGLKAAGRAIALWVWQHTDYPHAKDLQVFGPICCREFGAL